MTFENYLNVGQILISVLLITVVLLQAKGSGFGAGLGGAFLQASSFTTASKAYRLDSLTLDLQVNSATSMTAMRLSILVILEGIARHMI